MPLFRFLCALQFKSVRANFDFDPEKVFPGLSFYPRIEYGKCVFSLARWYVKAEEVNELIQRPLSISRLHLFCREKGIPSVISVGRGDQQLVFDLSNDDEALFFLETLIDGTITIVTESLVKVARTEKNADNFNSQFVLSLRNPQVVYAPLPLIPKPEPVIREFHPGSEWLYLKIYATYESIEHLLVRLILPWIRQNQSRIKQWFFVRYYDTGSHLRLRFKVDLSMVEQLQIELQSLFNREQVSGLVQKFYFDTYKREVERYSAELMEDMEWVFYKGSEVVAAKLNRQTEAGLNNELWPIVHCYQVISLFLNRDVDQISSLAAWAANAFFNEHGGGKDLKRSMDGKYRELRPALLTAMKDEPDGDFLQFGDAVREIGAKASSLNNFARQKLIADIVHMQINRAFSSNQRKYEAFIWHCILKTAVTISKRPTPAIPYFVDDR
jgi:thiopeptide-type bacteriocin biosynthesis protein